MFFWFSVLFYILLLCAIAVNYLHYMHMFQLNGYHGDVQLKWYDNNGKSLFLRQGGAILAPFAVCFFKDGTALIISVVLIAVSLLFSFPKKAKKKLVFTPRVLRMVFCSLLIYSLSIFLLVYFRLPFYLAAVLHWFTPLMPLKSNFLNKPVEKAVNNYYINDAKRIIDEHKELVVIGITGSFGKTSVKYYLNTLLSAKYNVLMTPESYNTTMGVVKTIRSSLSAAHEIFICEMGAKGVGEIKEICDIVHPKHSLITSIGEQHLESFKSVENIIKTKFEIAQSITDGIVFLNYDNEYIKENTKQYVKNAITYGIGGGKDYYATEIMVNEHGSVFTLNTPDNETARFETELIGEHNVENIVGAIAVSHYMGVSLSQLYLPVKRLKSVPHRMELLGGAGRIIIDDSFNSNPGGARAALETLKMLEGTRFFVTPGMVELGEKEFELNKELGRNAAGCCDYAVLVGENQSLAIKEGLLANGFASERIYMAKSLENAMQYVDSVPVSGKRVILLENDLPDNYN